MGNASFPESRITAMPPVPGGEETAQMVDESIISSLFLYKNNIKQGGEEVIFAVVHLRIM